MPSYDNIIRHVFYHCTTSNVFYLSDCFAFVSWQTHFSESSRMLYYDGFIISTKCATGRRSRWHCSFNLFNHVFSKLYWHFKLFLWLISAISFLCYVEWRLSLLSFCENESSTHNTVFSQLDIWNIISSKRCFDNFITNWANPKYSKMS